MLYASGVDYKVVVLKEINGKWSCIGRARQHSHTVRSIDISPSGQLVSGGVDTLILIRDLNDLNKIVEKIFPIGCDKSMAKICHHTNIAVVNEMGNKFKFYQLAQPNEVYEEGRYHIEKEYECYFDLTLSRKFQVTCFDIDTHCTMLVVGGKNKIRLFGIDREQLPWKIVTKDIDVDGIVKNVHLYQGTLTVVLTHGTILFYTFTVKKENDVSSKSTEMNQTIEITKVNEKTFPTFYSIQYDMTDLIGLHEEKNGNIKLSIISLRKMKEKQVEIITQIIPKKCFKQNETIYMIGIQGEMIAYSMEDYKMISDVNEIGKQSVKSEYRNDRVYFDPLIDGNFVVLSKQMISYLNVHSQCHGKEMKENDKKKLIEMKQNEMKQSGKQRTIEMMKMYPKIVSMKNGIIIGGGFLTNGDLIVITQQWLSILQSLPEPFRFYGKMAKVNHK